MALVDSLFIKLLTLLYTIRWSRSEVMNGQQVGYIRVSSILQKHRQAVARCGTGRGLYGESLRGGLQQAQAEGVYEAPEEGRYVASIP